MLIERQLEDDFITTLKSMPELSASQVVGSREVAAAGETKTEDDSHATIVAVACGFRQNDAFSLSPITMQMSIAVMTRTELDPTSEGHSAVIEAVADLLSRWHKDGNAMTEALSNRKFFAGELRMDGGTARTYDSQTQTWSETINFSIRGSEKFVRPTVVTFADGTTDSFDIAGTIENGWISDPWNVKEVSIGDEVTAIGERSFTGFGQLSSIVVPKNVTSIGNEAFSWTGLTEVVIEDGLTELGYGVFAYSNSLSSIRLPNTLTTISSDVFEECGSLASVSIPKSVVNISRVAFRYSRLTELTMVGRTKAEAKAVGDYPWGLENGCVVHCTDGDLVVGSETKVTYQNGDVVEYGITGELTRGQISSLTSIVSVEIGRGVTGLATNAFYSCTNLSSVTIPNSVSSIGNSAFKNCYKLTSISLPDSVTNLSDSTFYGCNRLLNASLGNGLSAVPNGIFANCTSLSSVSLPRNATLIANGAFESCTALRSIDIPDSVSSLNNAVFNKCSNLVDVHMPSSLVEINEYAFERCSSLSSIVIPEGVTHIRADAFHSCTGMVDVYCYPNPANLTWDEADKDDFKPDGSTICHVRPGYLDGYVSKFGNTVNVTFAGDLT